MMIATCRGSEALASALKCKLVELIYPQITQIAQISKL
jgi:hypothetical protein